MRAHLPSMNLAALTIAALSPLLGVVSFALTYLLLSLTA